MIIIDWTVRLHGKLSPLGNKCQPRFRLGRHWFSRGDYFPCYPLVQSIFIILYWMLIKYIVYITFGFKTIQVKWIFVFVYPTPSIYSNAHMMPVRIYGEPYAHKFCTVDIFWNITRRQAISPVAKFHHVLGRGFMIQRVILLFIKCMIHIYYL